MTFVFELHDALTAMESAQFDVFGVMTSNTITEADEIVRDVMNGNLAPETLRDGRYLGPCRSGDHRTQVRHV
ncbi:MAG: hypothetical protein ACYDB2_09750 [Acidimicrobiales bacterium]